MFPESNQYEEIIKKKHLFHLCMCTTNCHNHYRAISIMLSWLTQSLKKVKEDERDDGECESKGKWEEDDWGSISDRKNKGEWDESRHAAVCVIADPVLIFRHSDVYSRIFGQTTSYRIHRNSRLNPLGTLLTDQWTSQISLQRHTFLHLNITVNNCYRHEYEIQCEKQL